MSSNYDRHYATENYFGDPFPELIGFFAGLSPEGKVLDLGCGQGRDAISIARLGFEVTGIDSSAVGIEQMLAVAREEKLSLKGVVGDIYGYKEKGKFDIILIDSMFHFRRKEREKEIGFLSDLIGSMKADATLVVCLHHTGGILKTFEEVIHQSDTLILLIEKDFNYTFNDPESDHRSVTPYRMLAYRKKAGH